jgi:hypothetical protein
LGASTLILDHAGATMPAHYPVPIQEDVRDILVTLLGRPASVDKTKSKLVLDDENVGVIEEFITREDKIDAICMYDREFTVRAGAAIVMIPAAAAEDDLKAGGLPENHVECAHEVVNVLSRLLNSASTPHLRLGKTHRLPCELPDDVTKIMAAPEFRRDFVVFIDGYGEGRFSLLVN